MKRSTLHRKSNSLKKKQPIQRQHRQEEIEPVSILPIVEPILNPASQAKLDQLAEKEEELNQVLKIKEKSDALVKCFNDLADGIYDLSHGAQNISNTLRNWDTVFSLMGEMNNFSENNNDNPQWVRFEKSSIITQDNNNNNLITEDNNKENKRKLRK